MNQPTPKIVVVHTKREDLGVGFIVSDFMVQHVFTDKTTGEAKVQNIPQVGVCWHGIRCPAISYHSPSELSWLRFSEDYMTEAVQEEVIEKVIQNIEEQYNDEDDISIADIKEVIKDTYVEAEVEAETETTEDEETTDDEETTEDDSETTEDDE